MGGQGLCYGRSDLPVHARDVSDAARRLRLALPDWPIASSPLARARELVAAALEDHREPALWFTHAGVIRALHHLVSGIDRDEALRMPVPYATPVRF